MAASKAEKVAADFEEKGEDAKLPENVQEAIKDVKYHSKRQDTLLDAALARGEIDQETFDEHPRRTYRYEEVDGEMVEIRMNGTDAELEVVYLPGTVPAGKVDLASVDPTNVDALLQADEE